MKRRAISVLLTAALSLVMLQSVSAKSDDNYTIKVLTIWSETNDGTAGPSFKKVLDDFCATHEGYDYEYEYCEQYETASKMSILVASNDVPDIFIYEPGAALNDLIDNDVLVNLSEHFSDIGLELEDAYSEAALGALHSLSDYDDLYYLCNGLSGEAVWYNKTLFEENGLEVPETWSDLETLCDKLLEIGIQSIALPNANQWPLTRWLMLYEARLGVFDAHLRASTNDGIRFDDELFVKAADKIQNMRDKGYFGQGFNALTQDDAYAMFLSGKAAMLYQGTWAFAQFRQANTEAGELSKDEIGYFNPGPAEGSDISAEEVAATWAVAPNMAICLGKSRFDEGRNHEFLKFFFENYGNNLIEAGFTTPFNPDFLTATYEDTDILLNYYNEILDACKYSTLWREAKMDTEVSSVALENAQLLGEGTMSPEQYCAELAAAVDVR